MASFLRPFLEIRYNYARTPFSKSYDFLVNVSYFSVLFSYSVIEFTQISVDLIIEYRVWAIRILLILRHRHVDDL